MSIDLLLYVIAFILLVLAAIGVSPPKVSLGWLGLAVFVLTFIV